MLLACQTVRLVEIASNLFGITPPHVEFDNVLVEGSVGIAIEASNNRAVIL